MPIEFSEDILQNDNFEVRTDNNGDLIQEHKQTGAQFKFDTSKNRWVPVEGLDLDGADVSNVGQFDSTSVSTDDIFADNLQSSSSNSLSVYNGNQVTVSSESTETIFDVADPVDVWSGIVLGPFVDNVVLTYGDGTTDNLAPTTAGGTDVTGDRINIINIPPSTGVTKITFANPSGSSRDYGYHVYTR